MVQYYQNPAHKFEQHLQITFKVFHMLMNFLTMLFKMLYSQESVKDFGTLKCFQERISRSNVSEDVKNHYDADKDFTVSVINVYIMECVLEFFGMKDVNSEPTKHIPPTLNFDNSEDEKKWVFLGQLEI